MYVSEIKRLRSANPFLNQTELAYRLLLDDLLAGRLKPGDRLSQATLAQQMEMSRSPVREALMRLEGEGLLIRVKNGHQVAPLNGQTFADFMEFRTSLECFAVRQAAHHATHEDLRALDAIMKDYQAAVERMDRPEINRLDSAFHMQIARASHNQHLQPVYRQAMKEMRFYFTRLGPYQLPELSLDRHRKMCEALARHDGDEAAAIMSSHMSDALQQALRTLASGQLY